jgi:hypothetical protein
MAATRAYITGDPVSIDYLNDFVPKESRLIEYAYKSNLTLKKAFAKYPGWYGKRIINKQPRGTWQAKKAVYDWWLNKLHDNIKVGHRYYGIMVLAIYAKKCGVDRKTLEKEAFGLIAEINELTIEEDNHFTKEDVFSALEINNNYITFPIDSITLLTAIPI